ncbi:MAG: methylmalonyl-CoA mutase [Acidobacteria bacterium]|nr:methylmalonyl-CoA mutase [Acidobacteriota bacterium]
MSHMEHERKPRFETSSHIAMKAAYRAEDLSGLADQLVQGPGEFPFTRGIHPTMYRRQLWTMRQYAGFSSARESNRRYRYLLDQGQMGLSVAFDLPTQMGLDSDHPLARGEVGKVGVAIDSLRDMELLFDGIPLDRVSTSMTINSTAAILLAMYLTVAGRQGVAFDQVSGTVQNDILKEYIARGTYIYPPGPSLRMATDIIAFCQREVPRWNPISISGYHIREAGANAAQELAFTLADGIAYVEAALGSGLEVDDFAPRLSFFFNSHNHFLEEVAKFRAARQLWAGIMRDRFGARDPRSEMCRFHTQTAGSTLTARQPEVNVVRVTLQALAAVLGGTQSLHCNARDEALGLPTAEAARLALRTQQVIALESGVADTADPLAGSYVIEKLTADLVSLARDYLKKIDEMGGVLRAIETGWIQKEIEGEAYGYQRSVEAGETIVVGVNAYADEVEQSIGALSIDPGMEPAQVQALHELRAWRNAGAVDEALGRLVADARAGVNLMPGILRSVEAYATVGEISDVLRGVFGEYREGATS